MPQKRRGLLGRTFALGAVLLGSAAALAAAPFAYVPNSNMTTGAPGTVSVISLASHSVIATIPIPGGIPAAGVGSEPLGVVVSPSGARVYTANFIDKSVSVIDTASLSIVAINSLPVLCVKPQGSARPAYTPDPSLFYDGWVGGSLAITAPVLGTTLTSQAVADALCATAFGAGWRMAEFHDGGGGWGFRGYGSMADAGRRFWVRISDQPANCW
jgi:YVTN family beta-propeller protein